MRAVAASSSIAAPCENQATIQGVIESETAPHAPLSNKIAYAPDDKAYQNVDHPLIPFDKLNSDELSEIECLELLFFLCSKRTDSRHLAAKAIETYGSLAKIFQCPGRELRETLGLDQSMAGMFAVTKSSMKHILTPDLSPRREISSNTSLMDYLALDLRQANQEILRVIYLDKKCRIIRDEELCRGTIDTVPIYPREIALRSLTYCASSIILAHNHLSEDPAPSTADVKATIRIKNALLPLGIILHDHVIVACKSCFSLQEHGLI
ncbi:MAG: JAB domain-containing protein [Geminicoccaceae bacterium]